MFLNSAPERHGNLRVPKIEASGALPIFALCSLDLVFALNSCLGLLGSQPCLSQLKP